MLNLLNTNTCILRQTQNLKASKRKLKNASKAIFSDSRTNQQIDKWEFSDKGN